MKSFKQYLEEALHISNDIHNDITATTLKRIAKHSDTGRARFVIDTDNKLHGGDSNKFLHNDIKPQGENPSDRTHELTGEVIHNRADNSYHHVVQNHYLDGDNNTVKHKHLTALKDAGVPYKAE